MPLNLSADIERKIERVLILAGKPVMTRPIAAGTVLDALPMACQKDRALCTEVQNYLRGYMRKWAVTSAKPEVALTDGDSQVPIPNRHGLPIDSAWQVSASGYVQLGDYLIVNAGGIAYDGEATPTGSFVSAGFDFAQLDIGYRDHWWSPLTDSSSLISSEAPTMPSVTISNYRPLTPLGISYEIFAAKMSRQDGILYGETTTSGSPRLAGLHLAIEPVTGYAVAFNRESQYGGGARSSGNEWSDFWDALIENQNALGAGLEASNRVASLTSSILFPGRIPLAVYAEYAGEDNAYAGNKLLGATNFSLGLDFPVLWKNFDLTYELSDWQNDWYVHYLYPEGLTNKDLVIGHWMGDERQFGDAIGGWSQMVRLGWRRGSNQYWQATYRTLKNDADWRRAPRPDVSYEQMHMFSVSLATSLFGKPVTAELHAGQDVFGDSFARLAASVDFVDFRGGPIAPYDEDRGTTDPGVELFVDVGAGGAQVEKILDSTIPNFKEDWESTPHIGIGIRRPVSQRSDLGARVELDRVDGYQLMSFRALDYRFRWGRKLALGAFFGVGRYDIELPAYGYYWGAGIQYRDVFPKWDVGVDLRQFYKMGRDKTLLPNEPPISPDRTRMFFDVDIIGLNVSRRF
ncbi:MAG TPA: capsule assembly Wzi family protein [Povalibacter sp.]|uniref:capsule assembly Wzi family protein n=1 Tax=Povalibacter sp. TaxID=1962978 RepID=UPI002C3D3499|nr:capsule assembly Wzi family protein [Povalibacter sp.]HMN45316.1 capsule assembly Wzi family protein [Povalibacter sp.]